jgi:regulatory protein
VVTSKRPEALREAPDPLDARAARAIALDILSRRDHSCGELRRKLGDKGFDPAVTDAVVEALGAERLLDDHRYVENFVGFHAARGHGPIRVRADLRQRGLPSDLIDQAIDGYGDWDSQLQKARQKKFGAAPPTDYADKRRQAQFLAYRGYTGSQIRLVMGFDTDIAD